MLQLSPLRCWRKGVRRVSARAHGCSALGLNIISFLHTGNIKWQLRGRSAFQLLVEREGAPSRAQGPHRVSRLVVRGPSPLIEKWGERTTFITSDGTGCPSEGRRGASK